MNQTFPAVLTTMDYMVLESMLERGGNAHAGELRRKLASAVVVLPAEIDPEIVTLNCRVVFRLDGGAREERMLVAYPREHVTGLTLPVASPLGLALLGMKVGQHATVRRPDGKLEGLTVEQVIYQPEAHLRARRSDPARATASPRQQGSVTVVRLSPRARPRLVPTLGDDDPGPSAA